MIKKIAHVAIATKSIAVLADFYRNLGLEFEGVETVEDQQVKVAMLKVGASSLELLEATTESSPIARFIQKKGEGLHHISLEVDDIESHLEELKTNNVRLIDSKPRVGAGGCRIAFIHPESTGGVLVELSEAAGGSA